MKNDTIVSLCSGRGGAIALLRISGNKALEVAQSLAPRTSFYEKKSHSIFLGTILQQETIVDEVLFSFFEEGKSYTGEPTMEIACHASPFIIQQILELAIKAGARLAKEGEFTQRAFLNGRLDLVQAEAVAELIATTSAVQHQIAMYQMRGDLSKELQKLRNKLLEFSALLELEIDFSGEDVEFASREKLICEVTEINAFIEKICSSFQLGNAIKKGVSVVIVGKPNVGKSTLFNALMQEEKAIVSHIPGTTRDYLEDCLHLDGILFRFVDTAGLRKTNDPIEKIGIERSQAQTKKSDLILLLVEDEQDEQDDYYKQIIKSLRKEQKLLIVQTKADKFLTKTCRNYLSISAKKNQGLDELKKAIVESYQGASSDDPILTNVRHYTALQAGKNELEKVQSGIIHDTMSADILAWHLREALRYIGEITGEVNTEDILGNIFSTFCIGK